MANEEMEQEPGRDLSWLTADEIIRNYVLFRLQNNKKYEETILSHGRTFEKFLGARNYVAEKQLETYLQMLQQIFHAQVCKEDKNFIDDLAETSSKCGLRDVRNFYQVAFLCVFQDDVSWTQIVAILELAVAMIGRNAHHLFLSTDLMNLFSISVTDENLSVIGWIKNLGGWYVLLDALDEIDPESPTSWVEEDEDMEFDCNLYSPTSLIEEDSPGCMTDYDDISSSSSPIPTQPGRVLQVICISDTHCQTSNFQLPYGDILIHAGDFTRSSTFKEIEDFAKFLEAQTHAQKFVIAGNHEIAFSFYDGNSSSDAAKRTMGTTEFENMQKKLTKRGLSHPKDLLPADVTYLKDSGAKVFGLEIWGSPWVQLGPNHGYALQNGEDLKAKWDLIPTSTDIVITHTPPAGLGDYVPHIKRNVGCRHLLEAITNRIKPNLHVFGHIHEGYGMGTLEGCDTSFVNAAACDEHCNLANPAICIGLIAPSESPELDDDDEDL